MSILEELFVKYGTDKGIWGYTGAYEEYLEPRRTSVNSVLEIGICGFRDIPNNVVGASLFAWRDYFPNAHIYGLDNDPQFVFNDQERITTRLVDAYDPRSLMLVVTDMAFDFIVDDAVHDPFEQMALAMMLWPNLQPGGIYAIEDVCPYKVSHNDLGRMVYPLMRAYPDMRVREFTTHKDERLLILSKEFMGLPSDIVRGPR